MSYPSLIARRYFRSRQNDGFLSFISTIAIAGVMLGSATLIIALSVLGGFEKEITEKLIGFTSHVQIIGFQNQPLKNSETTLRMIKDSIPDVVGVEAYVAKEALIRSRENVDGILLKGLDPASDLSAVRKYVVAGVFDLEKKGGSPPYIVLGRRLAARLGVQPGDKVTVFGLGRAVEQGQMRVMQFVVSGLYESGMAEYDDVYAFTGIAETQSIFQLGDGVTGYDILLAHPDSAEAVSERARDMLGYPHYARTVFESYRNIFSWIELQKQPIPIILGLIIVVATVNVIGTLLMMVLSKTKEVGILMSMGATRWGITRIFLRQGLSIAFLGTIAGNLLAFALCSAQQELKFFSLPSDIYFMTSVPILLKWEYFVFVSGISIVLCVISSYVPARLASRLDPVRALRFA